jgi:hypothetical protein
MMTCANLEIEARKTTPQIHQFLRAQGYSL